MGTWTASPGVKRKVSMKERQHVAVDASLFTPDPIAKSTPIFLGFVPDPEFVELVSEGLVGMSEPVPIRPGMHGLDAGSGAYRMQRIG